jgi:predicted dehydrogenase
MSHRVNRRAFLKTTAAVAGLTVLGGPFKSSAYAANEKLNCAAIGAGGRGGAHVEASGRETCVALCDVDAKTLGNAAKKYPNAKTFSDYRQMFDEMAKGIDVVFVGTPDHHHAPASMLALKHKKHVYCEKPLTHSIYEARKVAEAAREAKVATQMGTQGMSSEGVRLLAEFIQAGAIGKVSEVHVWTDRPIGWWPQGVDRPSYTDDVPAHLNWDVWLGPAPERPFAATWRDGPHKGKQVYHPFVWRGWWDFGTGALGDIACHSMSPIFFALKLGYPTAVEAKSSELFKETAPLWSIITYEFPARGDLPPVKMTWYDGKKQPPRPEELEPDRKWDFNGTLFVGDKGKLLFDGSPRIIPEAKMKEFTRPEATLPRTPGNDHHTDFFIACRGGRPAISNFDFASLVAESALVGNLSLRLGNKRLEWDGPAMKATNAPEAQPYIRREYRKGWTL